MSKKWVFALFCLTLCASEYKVQGFPLAPSGYVEIDLLRRETKFINFHLGNYKIEGIFSFNWKKENGSLTVDVESHKLTLQDKNISFLKLKATKRGSVILLNQFLLPQLSAKGSINLEKMRFLFNVDAVWEEKSYVLEGKIDAKAKIWGWFNDWLASGYLTVDNGIYEGKAFSSLRLDFLGKPPLFRITNSEVVLEDGNIFEIEGELDLRNFSNILPQAEFVSQKLFLGEWQLFSEDEKTAGLKKSIDDQLDILVNAAQENDNNGAAETELRYRWKDDKLFKMKMLDNKTVLSIERRRDF